MLRRITLSTALILAASLFLSGCTEDPMTFRLDFRQSDQGWQPGFADYPVGQDIFYELEADYRALPNPLTGSGNGLFSTGVNRSDDLWMYYKGQIAGLSPNTRYRVAFDVEIATTTPSGCVGVGGAPGEGVTVKAGASEIEPDQFDDGGFWQMNVDKGNQTMGGENALAIGDMANTIQCGNPPVWEFKQLSSGTSALDVTSDGTGAVWLFVGTDSGFESRTEVYFTQFTASFDPL